MAKMGRPKMRSKILEDHGDWLVVDISTRKHTNCSMAVDKSVWDNYDGGKISANMHPRSKYITANYFHGGPRTINAFHRYVINAPDGVEVDHKTHGTANFIDNRLSNLRLSTRSRNTMNQSRRSDNTSGMTGISRDKNRQEWIVSICVKGKQIHLGVFHNVDIAVGARLQAEKKYFRECAYAANN